jgi:2-(1,2-epoxy-1,2-dihydrophenyl)acetyl-CoA isomerase
MSNAAASTDYGTVRLERRGAIAILTLNRPDRLNAYTPEMGEDLVRSFRETANDPTVAAVILTADGRAFCAGADRACLAGERGASGLLLGEELFIQGFAAELRAHPKLTIAAFNGTAVGIGVTMSLCLDLRLAADSAIFKTNFAELSLMPGFGSTALLPQLLGLSRAKKLLLCEGLMDAQAALQAGLIDEVCEASQLLARAIELSMASARLPRDAVTGIKRALNVGSDLGFHAALSHEAANRLR